MAFPLLPPVFVLIILCSCWQLADLFDTDDEYNYSIENPELPTIIDLGRDQSGCICRVFEGTLTVCFGRSFCDKLPIKLNITTPNLAILNTHIVQMKSGGLSNVQHVQDLKIEGNFNLTSISPGVFDGNFTSLENLSISYNPHLLTLHPDTFSGLKRLKTLALVKNGFTKINDIMLALSPTKVPSLKNLSVDENRFSNISEKDLYPMENSGLEELNLMLCQLEYLHPNSFIQLKNLRILRLGKNTFNVSTITQLIAKSIEARLPLAVLDLSSAGFRINLPKELLEMIAESNITCLNLAFNQFEVIPSDGFPKMPNLEVLDMTGVMVVDIAVDAFANLSNLETLILSENKLTYLSNDVFPKSLVKLDLQKNCRKDAELSFFEISSGIFSMMHRLRYLNLSFNGIYHLFRKNFLDLRNLEILELKNCSIFHIQNGSFSTLNKLRYLNLEHNFFLYNNTLGFSPDSFVGLGNLEVLLLADNGIRDFHPYKNPFLHLKSLKYLGLERNHIASVTSTYFLPLVRLQTINLSYNIIGNWMNAIFWKNQHLRSLMLDHNKLSGFTKAMLVDFSKLTELTLSFNPVNCDCVTFKNVQQWLERNEGNALLKLLRKADASCINNVVLSNRTINDFVEYIESVQIIANNCDSESNFIKLLLFVLLIITLFSSSIVVYLYRWHIKYWIFLTKLYLLRKEEIKPQMSDTNSVYKYDVFVSYSNEDRNFVVRLVTMLENYEPFLKLCVYERDFQVGSFISESVLKSVEDSRKILLVVSNNYVKSHWCRWESHIAEYHRMFFGNQNTECVDDALVLIKLGSIDKTHLTPMLKYLLKTKIYLEWDPDEKKQKHFWYKLRNTLALPKSEQIIETTHM